MGKISRDLTQLLAPMFGRWEEDQTSLVKCPACQGVILRNLTPPFSVGFRDTRARQVILADLLVCLACQCPIVRAGDTLHDGRKLIDPDDVAAAIAAADLKESQAFLQVLADFVNIGLRLVKTLEAIEQRLGQPGPAPDEVVSLEIVAGDPINDPPKK